MVDSSTRWGLGRVALAVSALGAVVWCIPLLWPLGGLVLLVTGFALAVCATGRTGADRAGGQAALAIVVLGFVLGIAVWVVVIGQGMSEAM
ncbi:hypothetical protein [Mycolicibacillus trivialis]